MQTITFTFEGFEATVIRPDCPNGQWIWKTEFLGAFDAAERELCERGYTRVYYRISNQYGSYRAVRRMHAFYRHVVKAYDLSAKCHLFGFSRGGLYAFNFALFYPECVASVYLDAPVLDMRTWPPVGPERDQVYDVYDLDAVTLESFKGHPIENLAEFFSLGIPTLIVAGAADELVPFDKNAGRMLDVCRTHGIDVLSFVKETCGHHPHSLEDITPIVSFVEKHSHPSILKEIRMPPFENAAWIWHSADVAPDEHAEFFCPLPRAQGSVTLYVSADSDYAVQIGDTLIASGQYGDFEHYKIYDTIDLTPFVSAGCTLRFTVHYTGTPTHRYRPAQPGLLFLIADEAGTVAKSGPHTLSRLHPHYEQHRRVFVSTQLGYTVFYDATRTGDTPTPSVIMDKRCTLYPRPIRRPELHEGVPMKRVTYRTPTHLLIDLGREVVGLPTLILHSDVEQTLTVAWGEHITDGGVRYLIGNRHFYFTLRIKAGETRFTEPMLRLGCRYLEIFSEQPIDLTYLGIMPQVYAVEERPCTVTGDIERRIYDICVNTLRLCMMEHYVDCPWREQALYAFDSRNQMLSGYMAFADQNRDYARANLKLIGMDRREDGLLSICYPCGSDRAIPSFSLYYLIAMDEYTAHTNDLSLARELMPKLEDILNTFLRRLSDDLVPTFEGVSMWNFYDWSAYAEGTLGHAETARPDLLLNCLFILALRAFEHLTASLGISFPYGGVAERTKRAIRQTFLCKNGLFSVHEETEEHTELGCALALLAGVHEPYEIPSVCLAITEGKLHSCSLSMKVLVYEALLRTDAEAYRTWILSDIRRSYEPMLRADADTVWETVKGEADFDGAGSLCHGWSAVPVYIYHRLGVAKAIE